MMSKSRPEQGVYQQKPVKKRRIVEPRASAGRPGDEQKCQFMSSRVLVCLPVSLPNKSDFAGIFQWTEGSECHHF
jgi:hypothetical protein